MQNTPTRRKTVDDFCYLIDWKRLKGANTPNKNDVWVNHEIKRRVSATSNEDVDFTVFLSGLWSRNERAVNPAHAPTKHQAADRGAFICQSQSMNVHMAEASFGKLSSMHFYAWKKGLKTGMYYLRTRPKADAIQVPGSLCIVSEVLSEMMLSVTIAVATFDKFVSCHFWRSPHTTVVCRKRQRDPFD